MESALHRLDPLQSAAGWQAARPFPLLVVDDLLAPADFARLVAAFPEEPLYEEKTEICDFLGSALPVQHPVLREFDAMLAGEPVLGLVARATGKTLRATHTRAYRYGPASYLLPHADHRYGVGRAVAYAYYLTGRDDCEGGELELFEVSETGARPVLRVEPRANRLVLFDVSPVSLHQVREVLRGERRSIAGWYLS